MKAFKLALLAASGALALAGAAHAEDAPFKIAFNVGAATDYSFRGISQTMEDPQVFAGADATFAGIGYAGVWVSNVDFGNGTDAEFDIYGGFKPVMGPVSFDLGGIYYGYVDKPKGTPGDEAYFEFKGAASIAAGPATLGAAVYYSPEFPFHTGKATYIEANIAAPITNTKFSVSGALGRQYVVGPADYTTWNAGIGYAVNDHIGFDLRYWDTSEHGFGKIYGSRVILGVKATF